MYISKKKRNIRVRRIISIIGMQTILLFAAYSQEFTRAKIAPTIQVDYMYGHIKNPLHIPNQNNSHYVKLSVRNKTGQHHESIFNLYSRPEVGGTVLYGLLGSKDVLGSVVAAYPTWHFSSDTSKSLGVSITLGTGFAYFTRPFNKIDNPTNQLVGSNLTNCTEISPSIWFKFTPSWYATSGVEFHHFSNGHTAIPNVGMNDFALKIGAIYKPGVFAKGSLPVRYYLNNDTAWKKRIEVSLGRHEFAFSSYPIDGPNYSIYKLSGYLTRKINRIHDFRIGASLAYYDSYHTFIKESSYYKHFKYPRSTQTTVLIGHEFLFPYFGFITDIGIKVFDPFYRSYFLADDTPFNAAMKSVVSSKIGFTYYPFWGNYSSQKIGIGMFIKTNFLIADYVEFSASYSL